ncbi:hypothetical protein SAMYPH_87 [Streptomyces phage Samy]|uniref:hypothetical protein n=1 Tax=Streptomyces ambofaciens TaxID=1889 RepID=UPI00069E87E7|nr:hypothetical protein [Streptomyces ambofaciens]WNA15418.1 hypothetical protein SAMYPH_87 [Streptomyces phage Samy]
MDAGDGNGKRVQLHRSEGDAQKAARLLNGEGLTQEARLVELDRSIKALETWHHEWRLRWDADYRTLHPGEWCEHHNGPKMGCELPCHWRRSYALEREGRQRLRRREREDDVEIVTWSGHVLRSRRGEREDEYGMTVTERRRATRNVVAWVRSQVGEAD